MSVGVSLPHTTSPSSKSGHIEFFFISTHVENKKKHNGGTLTPTQKKDVYFLTLTVLHWRDTSLHLRDTCPACLTNGNSGL